MVAEPKHGIAEHIESQDSSSDFEKQATVTVAAIEVPDPDAGKSQAERDALARKLTRKVDWWLIPWLSLLYLLSFLDRTNIGNARIAGMEKSLGMAGHDYNNALTIFFVSYALCEPITNVLLKRMTPRIFFTSTILLWGACTVGLGLITNYEGLLAMRFLLGIFEAGLYPGVNYYLSCWYRRGELGMRSAIFFSMAAIAGSFGGLLAAVIAKMDGAGGYPGWAWIFIIEGLATVFVGGFCWWMVFDWPDSERSFLTAEEKARMAYRRAVDGQSSNAEAYDKRHVKAALSDPKLYMYMLIYAGCLCPLYSFSLFLPTIVASMNKYTPTQAQLHTVPPYICGAVLTIVVGYIGDKTKRRGLLNMITVLFAITGFAMLISTADPRIQYAGTFLGAAGIYPTIPNTLSWLSNNTEGVYKRGIFVGCAVGFGNLM